VLGGVRRRLSPSWMRRRRGRGGGQTARLECLVGPPGRPAPRTTPGTGPRPGGGEGRAAPCPTGTAAPARPRRRPACPAPPRGPAWEQAQDQDEAHPGPARQVPQPLGSPASSRTALTSSNGTCRVSSPTWPGANTPAAALTVLTTAWKARPSALSAPPAAVGVTADRAGVAESGIAAARQTLILAILLLPGAAPVSRGRRDGICSPIRARRGWHGTGLRLPGGRSDRGQIPTVQLRREELPPARTRRPDQPR
jgi:hypothetical protein